jgi:hypothetical protein
LPRDESRGARADDPKIIIFIGSSFRFGHGRLLEYLQAFSFRTLLAAPATDDDPFVM